METGSNKSLYTLIAVVVFGIFLSLSYYLYQDQLKVILANVMDSTSQMTSTKLNNYGLIPTDEKYFTSIDNADGTVTLTSYTGTDLNLVIPRTINEKLVTKLAPNFHHAYLTGKVKLKSVIIPDSVTSIGKYAFRGNDLSYIEVPSSVTTMENRAWEMNNVLTNVKTPENVSIIEDAQYYGDGIQTLTISEKVTVLKDHAFHHNALTKVTVPEKVTYIGAYVFRANKLSSITIPKNVTFLGRAFVSNNTMLTEINLPISLKSFVESNPNILAKTAVYNSTTGIFNSTSYYPSSMIHYY